MLMESQVPVVLIIFKRKSAIQVLDSVRAYSPKKMYIIADGGRNEEEISRCKLLRDDVERSIDWPCDVVKIYASKNLGCRENIAGGLSKVFDQEDRAIILEDDCVPAPEFFGFCEEMLERYQDNDRVATISGSNYLDDKEDFGSYDYLFSGYAEQCGWATWKRSWQKYDVTMRDWPIARSERWLENTFLSERQIEYWTSIFQNAHDHTGGFSSWAYPWLFMSLMHGNLSIVPKENLITNVGFTPEGTHVTSADSPLANVPHGHPSFPLTHPPFVLRNDGFDAKYGELVFYGDLSNSVKKMMWRAKKELLGEPRINTGEQLKHIKRTLDRIDFGSFERTYPISRVFGYDRGTPVDRYYIESFLKANSKDVHGRVLEIADSSYTKKFGGKQVTISDVLHAQAGNPAATLVGKLEAGEDLPHDAFDCIILTQTLQFIFEIDKAIKTLYRILKPNGVVLVTLPGISQISRYDMDRWGEYWRFTSMSAKKLFEKEFGAGSVEVETLGNHLTAIALLEGLSLEEVPKRYLDLKDPDYEVVITVRASKREA